MCSQHMVVRQLTQVWLDGFPHARSHFMPGCQLICPHWCFICGSCFSGSRQWESGIAFWMLRTGSLLVSVCSDYSRIFLLPFFMGFLMIHAFWMSVVWRPEW